MRKIIIFAVLFISVQGFAGQSGNGGNVCASQFTRFGNIIHQAIKDNTFFKTKIDMNLLLQKIQTAMVAVVATDLTENGGVADAKNYPHTNSIEVHQRWCDYGFPQKHVLVLHEYLGLVDSNLDSSYQLSSLLYKETGISEARFNAIFSETKGMSFNFQCFSGYSDKKIVLDRECARDYENHVHVGNRDMHRVKIDCEKGAVGVLEYYSTYLYYGRGARFDETFRTEFAFGSKKLCQQAYNASKMVGGGKNATVVVNLDSVQVELFSVN